MGYDAGSYEGIDAQKREYMYNRVLAARPDFANRLDLMVDISALELEFYRGINDGSITDLSIDKINSKLPSDFRWDSTNYPLNKISVTNGSGKLTGSIGMTPEQFFDIKSTARSAPSASYYVSTSGLDTNNGLTSGAPFRSIWKAIDAANAGGVPACIYVGSGEYARGNSFVGGTNAGPMVDMAFVADTSSGYRATVGPWDAATGFAVDATYTNTYSKTGIANCNAVLDRLSLDKFGNFVELIKVSSAALCNMTPGSWYVDTGTSTLYIRRSDAAAVTDTNTRYFRDARNFLLTSQVNVFVSGFDMQGSATNYNVFHISSTANTAASLNLVVTSNCTYKYGGTSGSSTNGRGLGVINWYGLVANFNCEASANSNDGFNLHNAQSATQAYMLNVNCTARNNGRNVQSVNGFTLHENCSGIDIAGVYEFNRGGTVHNIDSSVCYLLGTSIKDDQGDAIAGGGIPPVAVRAAGSAKIWAERVKIDMPPGGLAYQSAGSTSAIYRRNCVTPPQPDNGVGIFGTF